MVETTHLDPAHKVDHNEHPGQNDEQAGEGQQDRHTGNVVTVVALVARDAVPSSVPRGALRTVCGGIRAGNDGRFGYSGTTGK